MAAKTEKETSITKMAAKTEKEKRLAKIVTKKEKKKRVLKTETALGPATNLTKINQKVI